ncbi:MAG: hypothetical protein H6733_11095 [Alphaproteobacteria bacterium]|nr:hypothetical protein [Alphaproteobacteria bacterium]
MHVVLGDAPLAWALADALAPTVPTVVAGRVPAHGAFLWRLADLTTGEGVTHALRGATRVFVVLEHGQPTEGLFLVLRKLGDVPGAVAVPLGDAVPAGLAQVRHLGLVAHGTPWGAREPLVAAWGKQLMAGRRLWMADPGPLRPVAMARVVEAVRAAAERPGARWSVPAAQPASLPALATALAERVRVPLRTWPAPLGWAARQAGVDVARLRHWGDVPDAVHDTGSWYPTAPDGPSAWCGEPSAWR